MLYRAICAPYSYKNVRPFFQDFWKFDLFYDNFFLYEYGRFFYTFFLLFLLYIIYPLHIFPPLFVFIDYYCFKVNKHERE